MSDYTPPQPSQSESEPDAYLYPSVPVTLTESEHRALAGRITEAKALYIVQKHLDGKYDGRAEIEEDQYGVDLRATVDGKTEDRSERHRIAHHGLAAARGFVPAVA